MMDKREFIAKFVLAYVRSGIVALNSSNMDNIVRVAEKKWNEIIACTQPGHENDEPHGPWS